MLALLRSLAGWLLRFLRPGGHAPQPEGPALTADERAYADELGYADDDEEQGDSWPSHDDGHAETGDATAAHARLRLFPLAEAPARPAPVGERHGFTARPRRSASVASGEREPGSLPLPDQPGLPVAGPRPAAVPPSAVEPTSMPATPADEAGLPGPLPARTAATEPSTVAAQDPVARPVPSRDLPEDLPGTPTPPAPARPAPIDRASTDRAVTGRFSSNRPWMDRPSGTADRPGQLPDSTPVRERGWPRTGPVDTTTEPHRAAPAHDQTSRAHHPGTRPVWPAPAAPHTRTSHAPWPGEPAPAARPDARQPWPDLPGDAPATSRDAVEAAGPWPDLLDDTPLWTITAPQHTDPHHLDRLRAEQEGQPWNA